EIPIFTVVTDLGSGHATWFTRRIDAIFVASSRMSKLALVRGWVRPGKLVECGLPIRKEFGEQKARMGERGTKGAEEYQRRMRRGLGIENEGDPVILVMGGGEGVGNLGEIVEEIVAEVSLSWLTSEKL
ncbi:hypothetical protein TrRE_jg8562, partial [Triparma retinervis]